VKRLAGVEQCLVCIQGGDKYTGHMTADQTNGHVITGHVITGHVDYLRIAFQLQEYTENINYTSYSRTIHSEDKNYDFCPIYGKMNGRPIIVF